MRLAVKKISFLFMIYKQGDEGDEDITFKKGMLRFDVMEKPHSVHVAPSFYLWSII